MTSWITKRENVILRKVDIVDWESEAARQMAADYEVQGIPYSRVYDGAGKFLGDVRGAEAKRIESLVQEGLSR